MIRVLVADDHPVVRIGLREILARQRAISELLQRDLSGLIEDSLRAVQTLEPMVVA